ncbi:MAG TPA: tetratricopeptide repeat protein, partial [Isosphaeraceae bacterium]|nr:tetratricopeptide repeat protein [Isosphaeraceae bacterium]
MMRTGSFVLALAAIAALAPSVLMAADDDSWRAPHDEGWMAFQDGRLSQAEESLRKAVEAASGLDASNPARSLTLDHLAWVLGAEGKYAEGEAKAQEALRLAENAPGENQESLARSLNTLAA